MNDYQKIVESDIQTFIDNYDTRPVDLNTKNYERNIVFLGCSLTYGEELITKIHIHHEYNNYLMISGIVLILVFMVVVLI